MKKIFLVTLFIIIITGSVYSQDLIVTNQGDSINCKITKVQSVIIYYSFKQNDKIWDTLIPKSDVRFIQKNYYQTSEATKDSIGSYRGDQRYRIALNGGFSYHTAKMSDNVQADFKDYNNELRSGYHFGADFTYFYNESYGFGLKYNVLKSSNSMDDIYLEDINGNRQYGKMSDNLKISFIGPSFYMRLLDLNKRNTFVMDVSLGYLGYLDDAVLVDDYKISGRTLGASLGIGYDVKLSDDFSLGFHLSLLRGALYKLDFTYGGYTEQVTLEEGNYESLNRIDLSIGLVFGK